MIFKDREEDFCLLKEVSAITLKQVSKQIEAIYVFFDFRIELVIRSNLKKEQI